MALSLAAHERWPIRLVDEAVLTAPTFTRELHFLSDVRILARVSRSGSWRVLA